MILFIITITFIKLTIPDLRTIVSSTVQLVWRRIGAPWKHTFEMPWSKTSISYYRSAAQGCEGGNALLPALVMLPCLRCPSHHCSVQWICQFWFTTSARTNKLADFGIMSTFSDSYIQYNCEKVVWLEEQFPIEALLPHLFSIYNPEKKKLTI